MAKSELRGLGWAQVKEVTPTEELSGRRPEAGHGGRDVLFVRHLPMARDW